MGNIFETETPASEASTTHQVRSWADVSEDMYNQTRERQIARQNGETSDLERLGITCPRKPKVTKPKKVQKLSSLNPDSLVVNLIGKSIRISFRYDSTVSGIARFEIFRCNTKDNVSILKFEVEYTKGMHIGKELEKEINTEFENTQQYRLILNLVPQIEPSSAESNFAKGEKSFLYIKKVSDGVCISRIEKQAILFEDQEYTYKTWFGGGGEEGKNECVICLVNPKSTVISPCLHKCLCEVCAQHLSNKKSTCPLCRSPIAEFWLVKES